MAKDGYIRTRIDSGLKEQAELVFARLGLNLTDAINLFLAQVTLRNGLPFDVTVPETDITFFKAKEELLQGRLNYLNAAIEEAEADFTADRFLTPDQSKAKTRARLETWGVKDPG